MKVYGTRYSALNGTQHHSRVWANNDAHAAEIIARRDMGETSCDWADPSELMASHRFREVMHGRSRSVDAIHAGVWLAHLVVSHSGSATMLGDDGWLHAMIHFIDTMERGGDVAGWQRVYDEIVLAETAVPGLLP